MPTNSAAPSSALSQNLERAEQALARFRSSTLPHLISGRPHHGNGEVFDDLNPADNTVLCRVASGDAADVDLAARAAAEASVSESPWATA